MVSVVSASLTGDAVGIIEPTTYEGALSAGGHKEITKGLWFVGFCNAHAGAIGGWNVDA